MEIEMGGREEIIDTYNNDTQEWQESQMKYGELREQLDAQMGLIIGFDGLRENR